VCGNEAKILCVTTGMVETNCPDSDKGKKLRRAIEAIHVELCECKIQYLKAKTYYASLQTKSKLNPGIAMLAEAITISADDLLFQTSQRIQVLEKQRAVLEEKYWNYWREDLDGGLVEHSKLFWETMNQCSSNLSIEKNLNVHQIFRSHSIETDSGSPRENDSLKMTTQLPVEYSESSSKGSERTGPGVPRKHTTKCGVAEIICTCKKSRCLKMYCDCFAAKVFCSGNCTCLDCYNAASSVVVRDHAIANILKRKPFAFTMYSKAVGKNIAAEELEAAPGCNCKKTRCLKKYCICFNGGSFCSDSCKCTMCENAEINQVAVSHHKRKRLMLGEDTPERPKKPAMEKIKPPSFSPLKMLMAEASKTTNKENLIDNIETF